jgi:hypothetical protein
MVTKPLYKVRDLVLYKGKVQEISSRHWSMNWWYHFFGKPPMLWVAEERLTPVPSALLKASSSAAVEIEQAARCSETMHCPSAEFMQRTIIEHFFQQTPTALGKRGGLARAKKLSKARRIAIAKMGGEAKHGQA